VISFARGAPSADILPVDAVREAAQRALADDWKRALSYGTGIGHPALCEWIAERHRLADPAQVMVTNGSLEAGALLFQHFVAPGDRVAVEQPSYDRTLLLLERLGADRVGVPLEADGIDTDELERVVAQGPPVKLVHVIPNFHNPAGCTLSAPKRERLVELAAEHDFWIFEDDPYRELPFDSEPPPTMLSPDADGRVIHASSFSKTVSPGVRVGYLAGPADEIATLSKRANEIYISPNMLAEAVVFELCRSGALDENIAFVKGALRGARRASARGRVRGSRRRLLPMVDAPRGRRQHRAARRLAGGEGRLHPRTGLHAARRPLEPAAVVRERSPRPDRRGDRPHRARPRAAARRQPGLTRLAPARGFDRVEGSAAQILARGPWHVRRAAATIYEVITWRLVAGRSLGSTQRTREEEVTHR
jgi:2-aminoadipate transaminase